MKSELYLKLVNQKYELTKVLNKATGSYYHIGGAVYCPFHDNINTPAASIYENDDEQSLWCFSEQRLYKAADAFELLLNKNPYILGKALWDQMSPEEQAEWLIKNDTENLASSFNIDEETDNKTSELDKHFQLFKYHKITFKELKEAIKKDIIT